MISVQYVLYCVLRPVFSLLNSAQLYDAIMGACTSRSKTPSGRTLSSTTDPSSSTNTQTESERQRRAQAAEQRAKAQKARGTAGKGQPGQLGKKLASEQAAGGTGSVAGEGQGVTRGQESDPTCRRGC